MNKENNIFSKIYFWYIISWVKFRMAKKKQQSLMLSGDSGVQLYALWDLTEAKMRMFI